MFLRIENTKSGSYSIREKDWIRNECTAKADQIEFFKKRIDHV